MTDTIRPPKTRSKSLWPFAEKPAGPRLTRAGKCELESPWIVHVLSTETIPLAFVLGLELTQE